MSPVSLPTNKPMRRVALVEDDDVIRANYTDLLRGAGFYVDA
jgi:hypothetical protein